MTHICVSKQISFGSDKGLLPSRRRAIIWRNAGTLLIDLHKNVSKCRPENGDNSASASKF